MTLTQRTVADLVRVLARRLREALSTNPRPIFRNKTLWKLNAALAEAQTQLADTPAAPAVNLLTEALLAISPHDLRQSRLLRQQTIDALALAEQNLKAVAPSPWKEATA